MAEKTRARRPSYTGSCQCSDSPGTKTPSLSPLTMAESTLQCFPVRIGIEALLGLGGGGRLQGSMLRHAEDKSIGHNPRERSPMFLHR